MLTFLNAKESETNWTCLNESERGDVFWRFPSRKIEVGFFVYIAGFCREQRLHGGGSCFLNFGWSKELFTVWCVWLVGHYTCWVFHKFQNSLSTMSNIPHAMFSSSLTPSLLHTRLTRARITLHAHACHSLPPSPLSSFTYSAARCSTINYNFTAAPQAAKERCLCLFQIKDIFQRIKSQGTWFFCDNFSSWKSLDVPLRRFKWFLDDNSNNALEIMKWTSVQGILWNDLRRVYPYILSYKWDLESISNTS